MSNFNEMYEHMEDLSKELIEKVDQILIEKRGLVCRYVAHKFIDEYPSTLLKWVRAEDENDDPNGKLVPAGAFDRSMLLVRFLCTTYTGAFKEIVVENGSMEWWERYVDRFGEYWHEISEALVIDMLRNEYSQEDFQLICEDFLVDPLAEDPYYELVAAIERTGTLLSETRLHPERISPELILISCGHFYDIGLDTKAQLGDKKLSVQQFIMFDKNYYKSDMDSYGFGESKLTLSFGENSNMEIGFHMTPFHTYMILSLLGLHSAETEDGKIVTGAYGPGELWQILVGEADPFDPGNKELESVIAKYGGNVCDPQELIDTYNLIEDPVHRLFFKVYVFGNAKMVTYLRTTPNALKKGERVQDRHGLRYVDTGDNQIGMGYVIPVGLAEDLKEYIEENHFEDDQPVFLKDRSIPEFYNFQESFLTAYNLAKKRAGAEFLREYISYDAAGIWEQVEEALK